MNILVSTQKGNILGSLYSRCCAVAGLVEDSLSAYDVRCGAVGPYDLSVVVTFEDECTEAPFGWTQVYGGQAQITVAAGRLDWPWIGDRLIALVLMHEIGHALGVPRSGPVAEGQGLPHCTSPDCVMTHPRVSGWRSVWAWVRAGCRARFCASCAAALRSM